MKISGFTFVKNAVLYDYPIVEAITSILPLCDEIVVAVGQSDDETLELIKSIPSPKIKILPTIWDDKLRKGGEVLAIETNKAFSAISQDSDWAFYIQGDEVVHEKDHESIKAAMLTFQHRRDVDGLLFKYLHFFGSYEYIGNDLDWYPREIRIIKNNADIYSYRDAQGFRKKDKEKLRVIPIEATIYHYGWIKTPASLQRKQHAFQKLWHNDEEALRRSGQEKEYDYDKNKQCLHLFEGKHPAVMKERIARQDWFFDYPKYTKPLSLKQKIKLFARKFLGLDFSYRNYISIKE
jgi:glycosyltransferase involved in cell wall biosynthesis